MRNRDDALKNEDSRHGCCRTDHNRLRERFNALVFSVWLAQSRDAYGDVPKHQTHLSGSRRKDAPLYQQPDRSCVFQEPSPLCIVTTRMPNKLQQLRKEQLRGSRARSRKRGRRLPDRLSEKDLRKESASQLYGTLGAASPAKRIDPKTGEVIEIISNAAALN